MEAREGYKKTKLGWIPEEWDVVELGEVSELIKRKNDEKIELPILSISAKIGFENQKDKFKKGVIAGNSLKNYTLLNRSEYSYNKGNSKVYPNGCIYRLETYEKALVPFVYISFRLSETINNDYCSHVLSNKYLLSQLRKYITSGARQDGLLNVSKNDFFKLLLPFPSIPEQQKIAEILTTVDDKISSIQDRIQQTQILKKGLMEKLLTEGIGHTEFKDTKIGRIPVGWEINQLGEICDVKGGKRLPKGEKLVDEDTGFPYIRVADMYMGGIRTNNLKYVPPAVAQEIGRYIIGKDDLFISVAGTLGIVGKIPDVLDGANLTENADKLTNISAEKDYILCVLRSQIVQKVIQKEATINALPKLAIQRIKSFYIPLPTVPEQKEIATILTTVDEKLDTLESKKAHYETLKKGFMHKLLTGERRVKL